jgi:hypothetical protein
MVIRYRSYTTIAKTRYVGNVMYGTNITVVVVVVVVAVVVFIF